GPGQAVATAPCSPLGVRHKVVQHVSVITDWMIPVFSSPWESLGLPAGNRDEYGWWNLVRTCPGPYSFGAGTDPPRRPTGETRGAASSSSRKFPRAGPVLRRGLTWLLPGCRRYGS